MVKDINILQEIYNLEMAERGVANFIDDSEF